LHAPVAPDEKSGCAPGKQIGGAQRERKREGERELCEPVQRAYFTLLQQRVADNNYATIEQR